MKKYTRPTLAILGTLRSSAWMSPLLQRLPNGHLAPCAPPRSGWRNLHSLSGGGLAQFPSPRMPRIGVTWATTITPW